MLRTRRQVTRALVGLTFAAVLGCSGELKPVKITGRLVRNGLPIQISEQTLVTIIFTPAAGGNDYNARLDRATGVYGVKVPPGTYRVKLLLADYSRPGAAPVKTAPPKEYELTKDQEL